MQDITDFREKFERRVRSRPLRSVPEMTDHGVVLGVDTVLFAVDAHVTRHQPDHADLRLLALLGVACKRRVASDVIKHVRKASMQWASGNKSLARIHLAFASLPRLEGREDAFQLFWADELMEAGVAPSALLKAIDLNAGMLDLRKFNPNQPRVPAGNGRESGRWGELRLASPLAQPMIAKLLRWFRAGAHSYSRREPYPAGALRQQGP